MTDQNITGEHNAAFVALPLARLREMERLFESKNECSPAVNKAGRELLRAYQEAEAEIVRQKV